jgi:predicted amidohydrolase
MKSKIKVVAIQMEVIPLEKNKNIKKALSLMKDSIESYEEIDLFVLPEDFITGPIPYHLKEYCLDEDSEEVSIFRDFSKKYNCYVVLGSFIKKVGSSFYNTTLVMDRHGKTILEHRKTRLSYGERAHIIAGDFATEVIKTDIGVIGILNCWEIADPTAARRLMALGADIICSPSYWNGDPITTRIASNFGKNPGIEFINAILPARAMECEALVVYANIAGKARFHLKTKVWEDSALGQSQICAPIVGLIDRIDDTNKEGFVYCEFDRSILKRAEDYYSLRRDQEIRGT